jgi:cytochrome bd-type quinol oxidase subunit 1
VDAVWLARVQFALTIMFHFLFPPITMGLALLISILETKRWRTGSDVHRRASDFWLKLFAVNFVVGVATGIVMEFQFGTNWAGYSRFVGDVFGAPLAAEGVFAFFLESGFLGLLLLGRHRISSFVRWLAAVMVWLGSTISAFWILVANSWMQAGGVRPAERPRGARRFLGGGLQPVDASPLRPYHGLSALPALLFGVAIGNVLRGLPLDAAGDYTGTFVDLLNPFALLVGLLSMAMFLTQGAAWLLLKTEGEVAVRTKRIAFGAWGVALVGMPLVIGYTSFIYSRFRGSVVLDEHSY